MVGGEGGGSGGGELRGLHFWLSRWRRSRFCLGPLSPGDPNKLLSPIPSLHRDRCGKRCVVVLPLENTTVHDIPSSTRTANGQPPSLVCLRRTHPFPDDQLARLELGVAEGVQDRGLSCVRYFGEQGDLRGVPNGRGSCNRWEVIVVSFFLYFCFMGV